LGVLRSFDDAGQRKPSGTTYEKYIFVLKNTYSFRLRITCVKVIKGQRVLGLRGKRGIQMAYESLIMAE
jgi:hypothetical protein